MSYTTASAGAVISGAMQNATDESVRVLAKTALPGTLVQVGIATGKTITRWVNGEIDGTECFKELGQEGTNMLSGSMFAALGQMAIPVPIVGALAGSMIGYAISNLFYSSLNASLQRAKLAREERIRIERECDEQIKMIRSFRAEMEKIINDYLKDMKKTFDSALYDMDKALEIDDVDAYTAGTNKIIRAFGGKPLYENFEQFDALMRGTGTIKL